MTLSAAIAGSRGRGLLALVAAGATALSGCAVGTTGFSSAVSVDGARVLGQVVTNTGGPTSYWAEYGKTTNYGSETQHQSQSLVNNQRTPVTVTIFGLERSTIYHYRICARDSEGGTCGQDRVVTTQDVVCGQTVTADVKLTGNLACGSDPLGPKASSNGLVVGADGVDINLAGHGIEGGITQGGGGILGIDNTGGFDDLTVRNGGLDGWGTAVSLQGAARNVVRSLSLQGSPYAITVTGGGDNAIRAVSGLGRTTGLIVDHSPGTSVGTSTIYGVLGRAADLLGDGATVSDSTLGSSLDGVNVDGSANRLLRDRVGQVPGFSGPFSGIRVGNGTDNRLIGNEVSHILSVNPDEEGDGIHVNATASATLLRSNQAHDNQGDGIDVRDPSARLADNVANSTATSAYEPFPV